MESGRAPAPLTSSSESLSSERRPIIWALTIAGENASIAAITVAVVVFRVLLNMFSLFSQGIRWLALTIFMLIVYSAADGVSTSP